MKFGQRFSKNTFKSFLAALILTAGVVGARRWQRVSL